jgi:hypothetical protein
MGQLLMRGELPARPLGLRGARGPSASAGPGKAPWGRCAAGREPRRARLLALAPSLAGPRLRSVPTLGGAPQVLDDSTCKATRALVDDKVLEWKERGVNCECIRRTNRQGYKAGALKEARPARARAPQCAAAAVCGPVA